MDYYTLIIMAIIQGVAEALPISSFAHLMLYSLLTHQPEISVVTELSVELGSLLALIVYFRHDLVLMIREWCTSLMTRTQTTHSRLAWYIIIATIPVGLVGLCCNQFVKQYLHTPWVIALSAIAFGILMGAVDKRYPQTRELSELTLKDALAVGLMQIFALIPGASRSGVTMTAGRAMGMTRVTAARFSFMAAIPVAFLADLFEAHHIHTSQIPVDIFAFLTGMVISGVLAYAGITLLIKWIGQLGLMPFAIYRVILGCVIIGLIMKGVIV